MWYCVRGIVVYVVYVGTIECTVPYVSFILWYSMCSIVYMVSHFILCMWYSICNVEYEGFCMWLCIYAIATPWYYTCANVYVVLYAWYGVHGILYISEVLPILYCIPGIAWFWYYVS